MTTRLHDTSLRGRLLSNLPAHCNNKYEVFYSLWPCSCHSKLESTGDRMYFWIIFVIFIMAGFDDDDFSLSGLTQEGHEFNVTTVISFSDDDENYDGLLDCARMLAGEISDKTTSAVEGGVQAGVEPCVELNVEPGPSNIPISKTADSGLFLSNGMASSLSHSEQSIDVSFIIFSGL